MPRDLYYGWPWASNLVFAAVLFIFLFGALYRYRQQILNTSDFIYAGRSRLFYLLQSILFVLAWLAAMLALMQPLANGHYPEGKQPTARDVKLRRPAHEVVLLVDASASMEAADMHNGQTRLQYVNQLADELVSRLDGEQVSLYAFTSDISPLSPPTLDYLFVRLMLDQIHINEDGLTGTDFYAALIELRKRLLQTPVTTLKTIVIFSDGGDTSIETAKEGEKQKLTASLMQLITDYLKINARIYTVGMGSLQGGKVPNVVYEGKPVISRLNEPLLKQMAAAGHGEFLNANSYTVLNAATILADQINGLSTGAQGQDISNSVIAGEENLVYDHYFQTPLAVAILALLLAMYMPRIRNAGGIAIGVLAAAMPLDGGEVRPAEVLFEASQHAKAVGALEGLSGPKLKEWQNQTLLYDQGTVFLSKGEWEKAIAVFTSVPLLGDPPPVLVSSLKTNLGIALLTKARSLQQMNPPPYQIVLALQDEAVRAFRDAGQTDLPNDDSAALQRLASIEHAAAIEKSNELLLTGSALREGLPLLLLSLSNTLADIRFMETEWVDDKLKEQYLQLFRVEQEGWSPLWKTQLGNWEVAPLDEQKREEGVRLLAEAEKKKDRGQSLMQRSRWEESRKEIEGASTALIAAMRVLFGEDPRQDVLQHLLNSYRRALGREVLTAGALQTLEKEQVQLMQVAKTDEMVKALDELQKAQASLKRGERVGARFHVEVAQEIIRRSLAALQPQTALALLEEIVTEQAFAGAILHMGMQIAAAEQKAVEAAWKDAQDTVIAKAGRFLPMVLEQQTKAYRSDDPHRCQARPWDEVLPLFERGRDEAGIARSLLGKDQLRPALQHEGRALLAWQQALAALKKPVTDHSSPCQSQAKPKESEEGASQKQKGEGEPQPKQGSSDILRTLQELNEDDQLPKTDQGIKKQGLRPW